VGRHDEQLGHPRQRPLSDGTLVTVLHAVHHGDPGAPPLLALHGVTGHARRWDRLTTERWHDRHVVAVDLRGHGRSTWAPPWSIEQVVADVLDTLDHAGIEATDVVGHSYGGAIALHLLARSPHRVGRLVLLDPGFERDPRLMAAEADALMGRDGWATRAEAVDARSAGWLVTEPDRRGAAGRLAAAPSPASPASPAGPDVHPDVLAEIEHHLEPGHDGRFRFRFSRAAAVATFGELCRPVPAVPEPRPTRLVVASRSRVVTPAVVEQLERQLGAELEITTLDCGHMVFWDRFGDTADLVAAFLGPVPVGGR
jgi:lipase